jgi:hypothetical protein
MNSNFTQRLLWVLWPSFLVAGVAEMVFFSLFDPVDIVIFGIPLDVERMPVYTIGFFAFWTIGAVSSALTVFLERSPFEVNRCPLEPANRPEGCPKREDENAVCEPCEAPRGS